MSADGACSGKCGTMNARYSKNGRPLLFAA
jgi:hypothetical protein